MAQADRKTESFYIKGDRDPYSDDPAVSAYRQGTHADPTGTGQMGHASQLDMTHGATKVNVRYDGKYGRYVMNTDVYEATPGQYEVHIHCPKCHEVSRITSERKAIEFEGGFLSVERWGCCWEMPEGRRMEFGIGLCRASYAVDRNVLKDA
jgi:hypothetical protein